MEVKPWESTVKISSKCIVGVQTCVLQRLSHLVTSVGIPSGYFRTKLGPKSLVYVLGFFAQSGSCHGTYFLELFGVELRGPDSSPSCTLCIQVDVCKMGMKHISSILPWWELAHTVTFTLFHRCEGQCKVPCRRESGPECLLLFKAGFC